MSIYRVGMIILIKLTFDPCIYPNLFRVLTMDDVMIMIIK